MKLNPVKLVRNASMATLAAGMLSACNYTPEKTKEYFADKPVTEYLEFVDDCNKKKLNSVQSQAKLDSLAYREIFNATNAVNNYEIVKEYNDIAKSTTIGYDAKKNLAKTGISLNEYNKILKTSTQRGGHLHAQLVPDYPKIQHRADSIFYRKFFEKYNLLDTENLAKFNEITEKIRPYND